MKKILFCGGGSAGHVTPNIAVYENLKGQIICEYAGTDGIEREICKKEGIKFYTFSKVKLIRGNIFKNLGLPYKLIRAIKEAGKIIDEASPDCVFCKGGYASIPPAVAARKRGVPVFTHESDLSIGLANKIISRFCVKTFTSFPETAKKVKRGICSGPPVRRCALADGNDCYKKEKPVVLVFGGSSGSEVINCAIRKIAPILCRNYRLIHICGKGNIFDTNIKDYRQFEYVEDIGRLYSLADCAVARCGSNSAFELLTNKIPTLFIPLENSRSRGDQVQNAAYFLQHGLCRVLRQKELNPQRLLQEIELTLQDRELKAALDKCTFTDGSAVIGNYLKNYLSGQTFN